MQRSHFADSYSTNHPSETTGDNTPVGVRNGSLYPVPTEQVRSRSWSDSTPPVMFRGTFMRPGNDVPTGRLVISWYGLIKCNNLENAFNVHFSREISRENH